MWLALAASLLLYPLDGYERTGIRRLLLGKRLIEAGAPQAPPAGARGRMADTRLRLRPAAWEIPLPLQTPSSGSSSSASFEIAIRATASRSWTSGVRREPHLATRRCRGDRSYQPGSVGKLAVCIGAVQPSWRGSDRQPRDAWRCCASVWWSPTRGREATTTGSRSSIRRPSEGLSRRIREGDVFSLFEWLDHMLSPSSNAAASIVWKEAMLMRGLGDAYPPTAEDEQAFFDQTSRRQLQQLMRSVVSEPLSELGIEASAWRLGSFFTDYGQRRLGQFGSSATPRGVMRFLVRLEQGLVVDLWTSLELKRLMYVTRRRIRYASAPRLGEAAVYFKSGSLYRCREEASFECKPYAGNVENYMNSVAIVERPDGRAYLVVLMSNVLRINSAVEHQSLATLLDRLLR